MNYVYTLVLAVCVTYLLFGNEFNSAWAEDTSKAKIAAQGILDSYKEKLDPVNYNFANREELVEATLGISVPIYRMDISMVADNSGDLASTMKNTDLVEYAVNLKGNTVTRMTVKKSGDTYSHYGFGGNGPAFAKGLSSIPERDQPDVKLVKLGPAEFLDVNISEQEWLIYISQVPLEGIKDNEMYKAEELAPRLQVIAKQMIATSDFDAGMGSKFKNEGSWISSNLQILLILIGIAALAGFIAFRLYKKNQSYNEE